jgi:hypothetical protein
MAISKVNPVSGGKTMFRTTLTSGTSYTVPAGVTYLNVTLFGGGGGSNERQGLGGPGQMISSTLSVTAGASIAYAIGGGGNGGNGIAGTAGGTTTFTGATSASGGFGGTAGVGNTGMQSPGFINHGAASAGGVAGGGGGSGSIIVEYWA